MITCTDGGQPKLIRAEMGIIGSVLLDNTAFDIAMEIVKPEDFTSQVAGIIFSAMRDLSNAGKSIDMATILSVVWDNPIFQNNSGLEFLTDSTTQTPSASLVQSYCEVVRGASIQRKVIEFSEKIKSVQWSVIDNVDLEVAKLSDELLSISSANMVTPWKTFSSAIQEAAASLCENDEDSGKIMSGFIDLDRMLAGFRPGTLTIIAARPAMGKTALAVNMIANVALKANKAVAFFSLEMTTKELVYRIISITASVNGKALQSRHLTDEEWDRTIKFAEKYKDSNIIIDDTPGIDIAILSERAKRIKRQHGLDILFIDYLQLMHADTRSSNREQEIATISRRLKDISKELNVPVIALAQINRAVESRADKRPIPSDLRESGAIEQDADNIMFIYREDAYRNNEEPDHIAEIIIAKQRSGPTGVVKLHWDDKLTRFDNLETHF